MKRQEFTLAFVEWVIRRSPNWLPEETTEDEFLNIMHKRIYEHNFEIRKVLNERTNAAMD